MKAQTLREKKARKMLQMEIEQLPLEKQDLLAFYPDISEKDWYAWKFEDENGKTYQFTYFYATGQVEKKLA
ncbi:hypothetical protein [Metabacillus fastidiosus]|uniref:hypothetical protein n=1 Tax=Metabacillus fastidiosus TaxID=1458 RepID=UPI002E22E780|nr:hypothetical protein [Metabacillus fastidiosus]